MNFSREVKELYLYVLPEIKLWTGLFALVSSFTHGGQLVVHYEITSITHFDGIIKWKLKVKEEHNEQMNYAYVIKRLYL